MSVDPSAKPAGGVFTTVSMIVVGGSNDTLRVDLSWLAADPHVVAMVVRTHAAASEWLIDRELLADGLERPVGEGDVRIRPQRFGPFIDITLDPPKHDAVTLMCPAATLRSFIAETLRCLPLDTPITVPDPSWFGGGERR